ncbi:VASP homolog [Olea europaea subsp. europaea]|uniref:VASP homolog n=1 Tax=Olea europaea subsp. europaea TaxID=158383 RepID=A0A8S0QLT7_OLEEU|nr:VASP homolog [Olea europaea subsp. europaea]
MKNTSSGDAEGSSPNSTNPPQQLDQSSPTSSPLRRPPMAPSVMGNLGHSGFRPYRPQGRQQFDQSSPQRGSNSNISSPMQRPPVAPPPPPPPPLPLPVIGHTGQSAFMAHWPQGPQPQRQFLGGGGSSGGAACASGNASSNGLFGAQAIPVGRSGGYRFGGVGIGNPVIRKRVKEGNQGGQAEGGNPFQCRVCGKQFQSAKALFGHMRQLPDRGWKGTFPPPSFRAEEEFAEVPGHLNPGRAAAAGDAAAAQAGEEATEVHEGREEAGDGLVGPQNYKLPDLNYKPPHDDHDAAA